MSKFIIGTVQARVEKSCRYVLGSIAGIICHRYVLGSITVRTFWETIVTGKLLALVDQHLPARVEELRLPSVSMSAAFLQ